MKDVHGIDIKRSEMVIKRPFVIKILSKQSINEAYIGSQFDTLQTFAMKKTNISEKDHKE